MAYTPTFTNDSDSSGRRVRLRPKPAAINQILGNSPLLSVLKSTNGMFWPYRPSISYSQNIEYSSQTPVHSNQEILNYNRTDAVTLTVSGPFTVQNEQEGIYAMACIHFLRTVSKMYFGSNSTTLPPGTPPPVLLFDAYGQYMFNKLPVVVTSFNVELSNDVDYVPVNMSSLQIQNLMDSLVPASIQNLYSSIASATSLLSNNNPLTNMTDLLTPSASISTVANLITGGPYVWLPANFNISVTMTQQQPPSNLISFNLDDFRNGTLLKKGGWI